MRGADRVPFSHCLLMVHLTYQVLLLCECGSAVAGAGGGLLDPGVAGCCGTPSGLVHSDVAFLQWSPCAYHHTLSVPALDPPPRAHRCHPTHTIPAMDCPRAHRYHPTPH